MHRPIVWTTNILFSMWYAVTKWFSFLGRFYMLYMPLVVKYVFPVYTTPLTRDPIITSVLRQNGVGTPFWRNNDFIITPHAHRNHAVIANTLTDPNKNEAILLKWSIVVFPGSSPDDLGPVGWSYRVRRRHNDRWWRHGVQPCLHSSGFWPIPGTCDWCC